MAPGTSDFRVGDFCLQEGLITEDQLKEALREAKILGTGVAYTLVSLGLVDERDLLGKLGRHLGVVPLDLARVKLQWRAIRLIPGGFAHKHLVLPLRKTDQALQVVMVNPTDQSALDDLRFMTGLEIRTYLAGEYALRRSLEKYYPPEGDYRDLCFFIGPPGERSKVLVEEIIQPALEDSYAVRRMKWDPSPAELSSYRVSPVKDADLVIADLTSLDPRVFYLLGIRHVFDPPTILIAEAGEEIPFAEMAAHAIEISTDPAAREEAVRLIQEAEEAWISDPERGNAWSKAFADLDLLIE